MPDYGDVRSSSLLIRDHTNPASSSYWNQRYGAEYTETFDWLFEYADIQQIIPQIFQLDSQILMVGSGNASFSSDL